MSAASQTIIVRFGAITAKKPIIEPNGVGAQEHNIGSELQTKMIKLSKSLSLDEKLKYIKLFK